MPLLEKIRGPANSRCARGPDPVSTHRASSTADSAVGLWVVPHTPHASLAGRAASVLSRAATLAYGEAILSLRYEKRRQAFPASVSPDFRPLLAAAPWDFCPLLAAAPWGFCPLLAAAPWGFCPF